jgi:hypothetical protein
MGKAGKGDITIVTYVNISFAGFKAMASALYNNQFSSMKHEGQITNSDVYDK